MRPLLIIGLLISLFFIYSCSTLFDAYIRNMTSENAIIDVFLLDKTQMKTLPNKVKVANRIVNFKGAYKKYIDSTQNVVWLDTSHFKLEIKPNTTVDLSDMAGRFVNSFPRGDVKITITINSKIETLLNGRRDFRHELFSYKGRFFSPVLYYDIE